MYPPATGEMQLRSMTHQALIADEILKPIDGTLTERQAAFAEAYVANGGKLKAAAIAAGYPAKGAQVEASRLIRNPKIQQAIARQTMQEIGLSAAPALMQVKRLMRTAKSDYVKLEASRDILDRAGFKPPDRMAVQVDAELHVTFDIGLEGGSKTQE